MLLALAQGFACGCVRERNKDELPRTGRLEERAQGDGEREGGARHRMGDAEMKVGWRSTETGLETRAWWGKGEEIRSSAHDL